MAPQAGWRMGPWIAGFTLPMVAAWTWFFPAFAGPLLVLLAAAGLAVWWRPALALAILPAAMPALDLAPWTGRFFLDAFDLLSAVCLAVAFARSPATVRSGRGANALTLAFGLLAISFAVSTWRALWPLQPLDANSFVSYDSPYNALRIVKGAVWACLFVGLYRRLGMRDGARSGEQAALFGAGMAVGLALSVVCILWERVTFVGLFDFSSTYRVSGPFSAMHKGGAYVECDLVVASAFVVVAVIQARSWAVRLGGALLLVGAGYSLAVTYSRNGYAAMAVMLVVALATGVRWRSASRRDLVGACALLILVIGAAMPVVLGSFARERLAKSWHDMGVRRAHWADALALRDGGWVTQVFGEGVGRFPDLHFWRSREPLHAASYRLLREGRRDFLRLGPGATLYIEQIVDPVPGAELVLTAALRSSATPATLRLALCEKWLLTSVDCANATASAAGPAGSWQQVKVALRAPPRSTSVWPFRPLRKLALLTPSDAVTVDVTQLHLRAADGADLLANGSFGDGLDRWFFATDIDPPFHIHSLPVSVLFDQGWFGVLAWAAVALVAIGRGIRLVREGRAPVPAALPALAGFLVCASVNTLFDAPRFLWLLLVLMWLAGAAGPGRSLPGEPRGPNRRSARPATQPSP